MQKLNGNKISKKILSISFYTFCNDFTPFKRNISVAYLSFPQKRISVKKHYLFYTFFPRLTVFSFHCGANMVTCCELAKLD